MNTIKYEVTVVRVGDIASAFADEGILVFFGENAPEELHDIAILVDHKELLAPVEPGDILEIDGRGIPVISVGEVANENLGNLGHLVVKFNGLEEPELPGDVSVAVQPVPPVQAGTILRILKGDL